MNNNYLYDCNLNIEKFVHTLDDPTECYKFYWLDSIMNLISEGKEVITFDDVIIGMIADAWYSVTEYHLRLGTIFSEGISKNGLERAVNKLSEVVDLNEDEQPSRTRLVELIRNSGNIIKNEKNQVAKNVPYRILSSFMSEIGGNDRIWDQRKKLISYIEAINETRCLPYTIKDGVGLSRQIIIDKRWMEFFNDNMIPIRGWIKMKKIKYLQDRNPNVPGILYKLEPDSEQRKRKIQNVRMLWSAILDISKIDDIYLNDRIQKNDYEIDHFIPWSYIANDEIWNLIPTIGSVNSSKSNKLPEWNLYFDSFVKNQFIMNTMIHTYPEIGGLFKSCRRDNINEVWPLEELYTSDITEIKFGNILEEKIKPIYNSARSQGYGIWKNKG